jgi:tetratricopeptide (TPR) repeat protein
VDRALAEQGRNRLAEAEADLTRAIDLGARETRLYFLRARVRAKQGDAAGAAADRAEGRKREPADEKSWVARGIDRLATDPAGALADFTAAAKVNPRSVLALQNQAHVLAERLNRPDDAVAALDKAAGLRPESGEILCGRGVLLARLGRFDAARRDAEAALRSDPSPARRYQAACVYALTTPDRASDAIQALALLGGALRDGYGHDLLGTDHDLDPLRDRAEFRRLADAAAALRSRR